MHGFGTVVAIDMPLSRKDIRRRLAADDAVSRSFGAAWASAHSPNELRPALRLRLVNFIAQKRSIPCQAGTDLYAGIENNITKGTRCLVTSSREEASND